MKQYLEGSLPLWIAYLRSADFTKFDMGQLYMMIALSILPVVLVYLFLSKFIVKGGYHRFSNELSGFAVFHLTSSLRKPSRKAGLLCVMR